MLMPWHAECGIILMPWRTECGMLMPWRTECGMLMPWRNHHHACAAGGGEEALDEGDDFEEEEYKSEGEVCKNLGATRARHEQTAHPCTITKPRKCVDLLLNKNVLREGFACSRWIKRLDSLSHRPQIELAVVVFAHYTVQVAWKIATEPQAASLSANINHEQTSNDESGGGSDEDEGGDDDEKEAEEEKEEGKDKGKGAKKHQEPEKKKRRHVVMSDDDD
eukprot:1156746-Pelagomonas_calceolata.AAC.5